MADNPETYRTTVLVKFNYAEFPTFDAGLSSVAAEFGLEVAPLTHPGTRSDWPIVSLTGPKSRVRQALIERWKMSEEDLRKHDSHVLP